MRITARVKEGPRGIVSPVIKTVIELALVMMLIMVMIVKMMLMIIIVTTHLFLLCIVIATSALIALEVANKKLSLPFPVRN